LARVPLPADVQAHELDRDVRKELQGLAKETADLVARHLVMAGRLMDEEPTAALAHARAARALAGRVGAVREANGLVAYTAGEWAEALTELRTARRLTGDPEHLAVMADCERALGRPDRALLVTEDPQAGKLSAAARVELLIVASGARRDLGQPDAAVVSLQVGALEGPVRPWTARLRYAYADALLEAGRTEDARQWFSRAAEVDGQGDTDAEDRLLELDGMVFADLEDDEELEGVSVPMSATDLVAMVADMSTPRAGEAVAGEVAEPEVADIGVEADRVVAPVPAASEAATRGPAFSSQQPEQVEAKRPAAVDPGFRPAPEPDLTLFD
jgi:tetratricopeptide (TPR) repeat protein